MGPRRRQKGNYMESLANFEAFNNPKFGMLLLQSLKEEQEKNKTLAAENSRLAVDKQIAPKGVETFKLLCQGL